MSKKKKNANYTAAQRRANGTVQRTDAQPLQSPTEKSKKLAPTVRPLLFSALILLAATQLLSMANLISQLLSGILTLIGFCCTMLAIFRQIRYSNQNPQDKNKWVGL